MYMEGTEDVRIATPDGRSSLDGERHWFKNGKDAQDVTQPIHYVSVRPDHVTPVRTEPSANAGLLT
jgi:hypothetical protein